MTKDVTAGDEHPQFGEELRLLAEAVLERVEPSLRRAAAGADMQAWDSCDWCPVCALTALIRGEHHDFLAVLADHGTSVVTILREALAGVPVEPKLPAEMRGDGHADGDAPSARTEPALVNIPVTIKPSGVPPRDTAVGSGHNSSAWAPVV